MTELNHICFQNQSYFIAFFDNRKNLQTTSNSNGMNSKGWGLEVAQCIFNTVSRH